MCAAMSQGQRPPNYLALALLMLSNVSFAIVCDSGEVEIGGNDCIEFGGCKKATRCSYLGATTGVRAWLDVRDNLRMLCYGPNSGD